MDAHDPFGLTRGAPPPVDEAAEREARMGLVLDFVDSVLGDPAGRSESELFLASALAAWTSGGGSLERDCLKLRGPRGSHRSSPQATARRVRERRRASSR